MSLGCWDALMIGCRWPLSHPIHSNRHAIEIEEMVQRILTIPTIKSCERREETKFDLNVRKCLEYQTACTARVFVILVRFWTSLLASFFFCFASPRLDSLLWSRVTAVARHVHSSIHPFAPVHQMRAHAHTNNMKDFVVLPSLTSRTCYNSPFIRAQVNIYEPSSKLAHHRVSACHEICRRRNRKYYSYVAKTVRQMEIIIIMCEIHVNIFHCVSARHAEHAVRSLVRRSHWMLQYIALWIQMRNITKE